MARRRDGENIIVYFRVVIKSQPAVKERQAPGKVEGAEASARILARKLLRSVCIADAVKATPEGTQRNGLVSLPPPNHRALKTNFNIGRGLERNFLRMGPGAYRIVMALSLIHISLVVAAAVVAEEASPPRQIPAEPQPA